MKLDLGQQKERKKKINRMVTIIFILVLFLQGKSCPLLDSKLAFNSQALKSATFFEQNPFSVFCKSAMGNHQ